MPAAFASGHVRAVCGAVLDVGFDSGVLPAGAYHELRKGTVLDALITINALSARCR